jgi:beta-glucosidase
MVLLLAIIMTLMHWYIEGTGSLIFALFVPSVVWFFSIAPLLTLSSKASKGAYLAGMDMSMQSPAFHTILYDLVQAKEVPESRIEQTATRILRAKNTVGLFENPFPFPNNAFVSSFDSYFTLRVIDFRFRKTVGSAADKAFSVNVIEDSVTLLKNRDSVLPIEIKQGSPKRILVTGPCGNSLKFQSGAWTVNWQGADDGAFPPGGSTLFRGIKTYADKFGWTTDYIEGSNMEAPTTMAEAVARAQSVDYVVVCLGERNYAEGYYNIGDLFVLLVKHISPVRF